MINKRQQLLDKRVDLLVTTIVRVVAPEVPLPLLAGDTDLTPGESRTEDIFNQEAKSVEQRRVLVVDDERVIADSVAMILNRSGYAAEAKYSGTAALESIQAQCPDIIVSDVVMPDVNGLQLARAVRSLCPTARIVLFSGNLDASSLLENGSMEGYFFEILPKPVHPLTLLKALEGGPR